MIPGLLQLLLRLLTQHNVSVVAVGLAATFALVSADDLQVDLDLGVCPPNLIHRQLQVAYRCQPEQFLDDVTCGNVKKVVGCPKGRYIAIHSAALGRSQSSTECSRMDKTNNTGCQLQCVLLKVQAKCRGKRRCVLKANHVQFGQACPTDAGAHSKPALLRIRYACVRRAVLEALKQDNGTSRMNDHKDDHCPDDGYDAPPPNYRRRGQVTSLPNSSSSSSSSSSSTVRDSASSSTTQESKQTNRWNAVKSRDGYASTPAVTSMALVTVETPTSSILNTESSDDGVLEDSVSMAVPKGNSSSLPSVLLLSFSDWLWTWKFVTDNVEKSVLYLLCSLCFGIILLLLAVTLHVACSTGNSRSTKRDDENPVRLGGSVNSVKWRSPESESSTGDDRTIEGDDDLEATPGVHHHHHHHHRQGHSWHRRANSPSVQPSAVNPQTPSPNDLTETEGTGNSYVGTEDMALMKAHRVSDGEILPQKQHGSQSLPRRTSPHVWYSRDDTSGSPVVSAQTLQPTRRYYR